MKRSLFAALLLLPLSLAAQEPTIRTERNDRTKAIDFILTDKEYGGTMTVLLNFKELTGCVQSPGIYRANVVSNNSRILSLEPKGAISEVRYHYSWHWFLGKLDPTVDTSFVYLLPVSPRKEALVHRAVYVLDRYKERDARRQVGWIFRLERGDTVYAMRRGTVAKVKMESITHPGVEFTTLTPRIIVEHPDGSLAEYVSLDPDHLLVRPGDRVLPAMPLGLAGSYDGEHYGTLVRVYCYVTDPGGSWDSFSIRYLPLLFRTAEGDIAPELDARYTPLVDEEALTRELTRRELRRRNGGSGR